MFFGNCMIQRYRNFNVSVSAGSDKQQGEIRQIDVRFTMYGVRFFNSASIQQTDLSNTDVWN